MVAKVRDGRFVLARSALEEDDTGGNISEDSNFNEIKIQLLTHSLEEEESQQVSPSPGLTPAVPCFKEDLKAFLQLAEGE